MSSFFSPARNSVVRRIIFSVFPPENLNCENRKAKAAAAMSSTTAGADDPTIPQSERLCKVLPKVMETAIKGVKDLDEQVLVGVVVVVVAVVGVVVECRRCRCSSPNLPALVIWHRRR